MRCGSGAAVSWAAWLGLAAGARRMCRGVRAVAAGSGRLFTGLLPATWPGAGPGVSWIATVFGAWGGDRAAGYQIGYRPRWTPVNGGEQVWTNAQAKWVADHQWTRKKYSKTATHILTDDQLADSQPWFENHRRLCPRERRMIFTCPHKTQCMITRRSPHARSTPASHSPRSSPT